MTERTNNKSILVVEDDLELREIIKTLCIKAGWTVVEAGNGREAYDQVKVHKPDMVILDLLMPILDGFGFLKLLRHDTNSNIANTSVIVLSNLYTNESILRAESLKIDAYYMKSNITLDEVIAKANQILEQKPN